MSDSPSSQPLISIIVLNYNGTKWLEKCLASIRQQTIFEKIEVIIADNLSTDQSGVLAETIVEDWPNGHFVQNGSNLGFAEGNNRPAAIAKGKYLFFLNNDAWLTPDCLEILLRETEKAGADASTPQVLNYGDDSFQSLGAAGFDIFGLATSRLPHDDVREVLMPEGCSYLICRELFDRLGGFDSEFFMFAEELDLSWRVWISGGKAVAVPMARLHHRGAAGVNPEGGAAVVEFRTSYTKRFYANRNALLVILINAQHVLLTLAVLQVGLYAVESVVSVLVFRQWRFVKESYYKAVTDCWRLRHHIAARRARVRKLRQRGDWQMLRFFCWRLNRWDEIIRLRKTGALKITRD